jgi:uncharacterized membrane protein YheB (UPF0754 family)
MINILLKIFILSIIGASIGYVTNVIAIKLLFRPVDPINIIGFEIQGVIPKRQKELSKSIGETVENELLSLEEIIESFVTEDKIEKLLDKIKLKIQRAVEVKIAEYPLILGLKRPIIKYINNMMDEEGSEYVHEIIKDISKKAEEDISISKMVESKINSFDLTKVEEIVFDIAKKELRHIEILGAVLGFFIGIVQGIIVHLF